METQKIETWIPDFPGFYESIYDYDLSDIEWALFSTPGNVMKKHLAWICENAWEYFDFEQYKTDISKRYVEAWLAYHKEYMPFVKSMVFQNVKSPRQYNFSTDSIEIEVDVDVAAMIKAFIEHEGSVEYIEETYTSCSGFISSYENNIDDWLLTFDKKKEHKTGSILQCLSMINENDDTLTIYEKVKENCCDCEYINYDGFILAFNEHFGTNIESFQELEKE